MSWYLRSTSDRDTHRGELRPDGTVAAQCGVVFRPKPLPFDRIALPGHPPGPGSDLPGVQGLRHRFAAPSADREHPMTEQGTSTVTDPTDDTCPGCGATHGVQRITGTSPKVQAWMCAACSMHWATTAAWGTDLAP